MAIKSLRSNNQEVFCHTTVFGEPNHSRYETCLDYAQAEAVFKRRRPNPLTPTPFEVKERYENSATYSGGNPAGIYRTGTISYAFPGEAPKTVVTESDGKFLLNKARHKVSGAGQDLGETLAELDQTIDLVKKNVDRVGKIGDALRHGNWGKLESLIGGDAPASVKKQRPSKRLASGYLEIMFGILPLIESSHTAVDAYAKGILTRGTKIRTISGNKRLDIRKSLDPELVMNTGRATFRGTVQNPNLATLNSYGLLNPALMLYQRLPYSFVVDWFVPIAPILGSLTAEAGLTHVTQTYTDVYAREMTLKRGFVSRYVRYNRRVPGSLPIIGNPFGRPAQLSIGKLISAVALIRQRF